MNLLLLLLAITVPPQGVITPGSLPARQRSRKIIATQTDHYRRRVRHWDLHATKGWRRVAQRDSGNPFPALAGGGSSLPSYLSRLPGVSAPGFFGDLAGMIMQEIFGLPRTKENQET